MPNQPRPNVLSWASIAEDHTLDQAAMLAQMPFVRGPVVLMPDAHLGKGATIGSVFATEGAVIPAAVGVDIGCGMAALQTPMTEKDLAAKPLSELLAQWVRRIPAGVGQGHDKETTPGYAWWEKNPFDPALETKAIRQFGTLGSGNHFLELAIDETGQAWILLHSGSRGPGNTLAQRYIELAKGEMRRWSITLPDGDLAYLPKGTDLYSDYMSALNWAQSYAEANRQQMLIYAYDQLMRLYGLEAPFNMLTQINCHHNYAAMEHHKNRDVLVTRKGAIRARPGDLGLIPGSMGTKSYIVRGLGNAAALNSAPHGAGRAMSRKEAKRRYSTQDLEGLMAGKVWRADVADSLVDEIPGAYKDIDVVMNDSAELVEVVHTLRQVVNYKGL